MAGRVAASLVAVSIVLVTAACGGGDDTETTWPSVDLVSAEGDDVSTASWTGAPLVVNFWYSTCAPCARELADFAAVDAEFGDEVRFIGVNPLDSAERMAEFAAERGVAYELFQDPLAELQTVLEITTFPSTYFVSSSGEFTVAKGALDADGLRADVDRLLEAENG